jgi:hypothetical protein
MPRYRRPKQDASDHKEQDRGVPIKARRCGVLWLVHHKTLNHKGHEGPQRILVFNELREDCISYGGF